MGLWLVRACNHHRATVPLLSPCKAHAKQRCRQPIVAQAQLSHAQTQTANRYNHTLSHNQKHKQHKGRVAQEPTFTGWAPPLQRWHGACTAATCVRKDAVLGVQQLMAQAIARWDRLPPTMPIACQLTASGTTQHGIRTGRKPQAGSPPLASYRTCLLLCTPPATNTDDILRSNTSVGVETQAFPPPVNQVWLQAAVAWQ